MPYNYVFRGITYPEPPKQNALSVRAQRFRSSALCLSWINRGLTAKKNEAILDLIPEECKRADVNSTKAITSDLSKADADKICAKSKESKAEEVPKTKGKPNRKGTSKAKSKAKSKPKRAWEEDSEEEDIEFDDSDDDTTDDEMRFEDSVNDGEYGEPPSPVSPQISHSPSISISRSNQKRKWTADDGDELSGEVRDTSPRRPKRARARVPRPEQSPIQPEIAGKLPEEAAGSGRRPGKTVSILPSEIARTAGGFDESDDDSHVVETDSEPDDGDFRYIYPIGRATDARDQAAIQRALELTRIEFFERTGKVVPQNLAVDFCYESYAAQHERIQDEYRAHRKGFLDAPRLYRLPAWQGGFSKWKVARPTARNGADPTGWNLKISMINEENRQAREDVQLEREIEKERRAGKK